jgi:hypothetical protein
MSDLTCAGRSRPRRRPARGRPGVTRYIPELALLAALLAILAIAGLVAAQDTDAEYRRLLDLDPVEAMRV